MKKLLNFDEEGFYIFGEDVEPVPDDTVPSKNQYLAYIDENIAFIKPRLVDGQIVEGKTEDEFFEEELISSLKPSQSELDAAEFEIKILTLLFEMEVI